MAEVGAGPGLIYIVDDDISFREAVEGMVTSFGYRARAFDSAGEFLAMARPAEALCLILDIQMTGMNGLELQARLAALGHATPTIFISSIDDAKTRARALERGAIEFFGKPFDREALMRRIRALAGVRDPEVRHADPIPRS
jgi:FixJ family two-component response regulator